MPRITEPARLDLIEALIITRGPLSVDDIVEILATETNPVRPCMSTISVLDCEVRQAVYFLWGAYRIHLNEDQQWDVPRQR